jgi:hypothetical protein
MVMRGQESSASHLNAQKILDRMGGIDVPGSIEYFNSGPAGPSSQRN